MRILWLKSDLLLPLDKGGKLRTWHLLRQLSARHDVTYLAFADPREPAANRLGMRAVAHRVETVDRREPAKRSLRFYAGAAARVFDPLPYAAGKYRSRRYRERLRDLLARERFDLIVCDFLVPAVNLPGRLPCPSVLFTHNVEADIWRRHAETASNPISRALLASQHRRMLRFERRTLGRFDGILTVSESDSRVFRRLYPETAAQPMHVVATGVDTSYFSATPSDSASRRLVFTGSMDWLPNEDAMLYFCREILPRIRRQAPDVQLSIVGRSPTPAVAGLAADAGIRVTGRVDDVRPYINEAAVYIVPLRIGGGTRLKIFEAMAAGRAVVSTSIGAEGLPVTHAKDLLLADEPEGFSRAVVSLLRDVPRRRAIEEAARRLVVERYDWSAVAVALERALLHIVRHPSERATQACESQSLVLDT